MAMSYVYALHDFAPLNEDELSFKSGDKIEVIEKDEQYEDGWWTGKVITGGPEDKDALVGLFPGSYTSSEPPPPAKPAAAAGTTDAAPTNGTIPSIQVTASSTAMQETLTDVQQAIEQLAHKSSNPSFSFASSNIDSDAHSFSTSSEREPDSTTEDEDADIPKSAQAGLPGGFSHNSARRRLAAKARRAVEEAEKLENMLLSEEVLRRRMMPVDVEISDESEGEDDHHHHHHHHDEDDAEDTLTHHGVDDVINARRHSRIPEETEEEDNISLSIPKPSPEEEDEDVKTATLTSKFPEPQASSSRSSPSPVPTPIAIPKFIKPSSPVPTSPLAREVVVPPPPLPEPPVAPASNGLTNGDKEAENDDKEADPNSHTSSSPSSWTVQQVISWLKSKGFGADVCEKFVEQEITGDVLLALDINLLKTEIGIVAFGKRMRIANAITDLRRPPSIQYSDGTGPQLSPGVMSSPGFGYGGGGGGGHSRSQSLVPSHHSFPGITNNNTLQEPPSTPGHANLSHSISQSLSDSGRDTSQTQTTTSSGGVDERGVLSETETATTTKKNNGTAAQSVRRRLFGRSHDSANSIGTGNHSRRNSGQSINPPSSPLPTEATATTVVADDEKEPPSPLPTDVIKTTGTGARHKGKKSPETSTTSTPSTTKPDRLSIFGTSFGPARNRKPVPRYSALGDDTQLLDHKESRASSFHLPKLGGSSGGKKTSSGRPGTSDGSLSSKGEPGVLRKRTSSQPGKAEPGGGVGLTSSVSEPPLSVTNKLAALDPTPNGSSSVTPKSREKPVLDLSNPDFAGYLRKKGERYKTWKMRYLVLKGIDLWVMKSDKWTTETKPKGYINLLGYKVSTLSQSSSSAPANSYSFSLTHPYDSPHFFSSTSSTTTREWMKAIMKASISRDYTRPVISSCNIPTIPLVVAQAMNPAPRPPSPGQRERTQRMFLQKREKEMGGGGDGGQSNGGPPGVGRLSSRDARVLMGMPTSPNGVVDDDDGEGGRVKLDEVFGREHVRESSSTVTPPRPSRESRRVSGTGVTQ